MTDKDSLKKILGITQVLTFYGAKKAKGRNLFFCCLHEDQHPSLVASDEKGVATCLSSNCNLKRGSDIFDVIQTMETCTFPEAVQRAKEIAGLNLEFNYQNSKVTQKQSIENLSDPELEKIPVLTELKENHRLWLANRFGLEWEFLVQQFHIQAYYNHLALPIDDDKTSYVFIPLVKYSKENPQGGVLFYRGRVRTCQLFPNVPSGQKTKRYVFVCEGEKDVLRVYLELFRLGLLSDWAVITNTCGASALKVDTPLFANFLPDWVEKVVICYDNDPVGQKAAWVCFQNACNYFPERTKIRVFDFPADSPSGFDISEFLKTEKLVTF